MTDPADSGIAPPAPADAPVELIVCETCGGGERDAAGRSRGERLRLLLEAEQAREPRDVTIHGARCLWACKRACNVHVRAPSKWGYVLSDLEPTPHDARALLDYARLYAASEDGSVPFRTWPDGVRGHFACRVPPQLPQPIDASTIDNP